MEIVGPAAGVVTKPKTALGSMNFFCVHTLNLPCQEGKIRQRKNSERIMSPLSSLMLFLLGLAQSKCPGFPLPQISVCCSWCHVGNQCSYWREGDMGSDCPSKWLRTAPAIPLLIFFSLIFVFSFVPIHVLCIFSKEEITSRNSFWGNQPGGVKLNALRRGYYINNILCHIWCRVTIDLERYLWCITKFLKSLGTNL